MQKSFEFLQEQIRGIRPTISPALIETLRVPCYEQMVPIRNLALVNDTRQGITVIPFDKSIAGDIMTTITRSGFQAYYVSKGIVMVNHGVDTPEARDKIRRHVAKLIEDTKVSIRNIRRDTKRSIDQMPSQDERSKLLVELDDITSKYICLTQEILGK